MDEAERLCDRVAIVDHGKVIALGTPQELIASWAASTSSSSPLSRTAQAGGDWRPRSRKLPAVSSVRQENGGYTLSATEPHVALPALLDELTRQR